MDGRIRLYRGIKMANKFFNALLGASGGSLPALVQYASGTTADGSAGLTVPFGAAVVTGIGAGTYTYRGANGSGLPYYNLVGQPDEPDTYSISAADPSPDAFWVITADAGPINAATTGTSTLPWQASWTGSTVTCSSPVTAGNTVVAWISATADLQMSPTCIGGGAVELDVVVQAVFNPGAQIWKKSNVAGGETGISLSLQEPARANLHIAEFSGVADAAAFATNTASGTANGLVTGNLDNTGHAISLIVGIIASNDSGMTTMGGGGELVAIGDVVGGASVYQTAGYVITSTEDAGWSGESLASGADYAGAIAGFDPA